MKCDIVSGGDFSHFALSIFPAKVYIIFVGVFFPAYIFSSAPSALFSSLIKRLGRVLVGVYQQSPVGHENLIMHSRYLLS